MNFSTGKKLFLSHFLAIVMVSGSIGTYFYQNAIDNLLESVQARLKYSAALLPGSTVRVQRQAFFTSCPQCLSGFQAEFSETCVMARFAFFR